jgi:hypothetical protein
MKYPLQFSIIFLLISNLTFSQENKLTERIALKGKKECKFYTDYINEGVYSEWDGKCKKGFVEGEGTIKMFSDNKSKLTAIQTTFNEGIMEGISMKTLYDVNSRLMLKANYTYLHGYMEGIESGEFLTENSNETKTGDFDGNYKINWENGATKGIGTITFNKTYTYEGEFTDGLANQNGKGKIVYTDGSVYEGDVVDGKHHGFGKYTTKDQTVTGSFSNDNVEGQAISEYSNGWKYDGLWKDSKYNGKGTLTTDKGTLKAQFSDHKVSGKGTFTYNEGATYVGTFNNNFASEGFGIITYADKDTFEGEFKDGYVKKGLYTGKGFIYDGSFNTKGSFYGKGILTKTDSQAIKKIVANFTNNDKGNGKIYYGDGVIYDGIFVNNEPNGDGTMEFSDDYPVTKIVGNFINKYNGVGKIFFTSGILYYGEFENWIANGPGTTTLQNGARSKGNFVNGSMEGNFILTNPEHRDLDYIECYYVNNEIKGEVIIHNTDGTIKRGDINEKKVASNKSPTKNSSVSISSVRSCKYCGKKFNKSSGYLSAAGGSKCSNAYSTVAYQFQVARQAGYSEANLNTLQHAYDIGYSFCSKKCSHSAGYPLCEQ